MRQAVCEFAIIGKKNQAFAVNIQTPDLGGGEIRFDGVLVRKDGLFVLPDLEGLNPDKLSA